MRATGSQTGLMLRRCWLAIGVLVLASALALIALSASETLTEGTTDVLYNVGGLVGAVYFLVWAPEWAVTCANHIKRVTKGRYDRLYMGDSTSRFFARVAGVVLGGTSLLDLVRILRQG